VGKVKTKTFTLSQVTRAIAAGDKATIKVKLGAALRERIKKALAAHKSVKAKLRIRAADSAGNTKKLVFTISLKKK